MPRFYVPFTLAVDMPYQLPTDVARHIQVLRLRVGDTVTLFDGNGGAYTASLLDIDKKHASVSITAHQADNLEPPYRLTLAQGIAGGDKMDWLIEKAVELGVHRIMPVTTARSVVRLQGDRATKRHAHWQALTRAACEQCGRNLIPAVDAPRDWPAWLAQVDDGIDGSAATMEGRALRILLSPRADLTFNTLPAAAPPAGVTLLIGPEGGLTQEEEAAARAAGFVGLGLGPRILRTETAGIAVLAALAARWGGW